MFSRWRSNPKGLTFLATLCIEGKENCFQQKKEHRLLVTLVAIVVLFILFWLPAIVVLSAGGIWEAMPSVLWPIAIWLALCNSAVNSIVYGVMNKNFRAGYLDLIEHMCCFWRFVPDPDTRRFGASPRPRIFRSGYLYFQSKCPLPRSSVTKRNLMT